MSDKQTMTLNLSAREMSVVEQLADEMDVSKTSVLRSALRLYQLVHIKAKAGHHLMFSGEPPMMAEIIAPGFGEPS